MAYNVWRLSAASKYEEREPRSRRPKLVSVHTFGWDRDARSFVLTTDAGLGLKTEQRLAMPVELAEAFLVRCVDPAFNECFLTSMCPLKAAVETVEAGGAKLVIERDRSCSNGSASGKSHILAGLSIGFSGTDNRLFLYSELRMRFGVNLRNVSADVVRAKLRTPAAA